MLKNFKDVEEEIEIEIDKTYDEHAAGRYPLRLISSSDSLFRNRIALICKSEKNVKLYQVKDKKIRDEIVIPLLSCPCDAVFTHEGNLLVLIPAPYYLKYYEIKSSDELGLIFKGIFLKLFA